MTGIDHYLAAVREPLQRLHPHQAQKAADEGAILVDTRPQAHRDTEGTIPGALIIERNHLEWRCDPASEGALPEAAGTSTGIQWIVVCDNDVSFEGMRWVTVGSPLQPDVEIVLEPPLADPNASPEDKEAMAELLTKGLLRGVIFSTSNCDATFERILMAGTEVAQEPLDQPYGVRDCAFRDPAGNLIRFAEPLGR